MQPTHAQLDAVRDRYEALEDPAAFEALTAERRAQVAHRAAAPWRTVDSRPDPWSALSEVPSERSSEALDEGWQLGLDRAGEVVLAELFFDDDWRAVVEVITRHDHRIEVVSWRQDELEVRTLWLDGSRPVCLVATGSMRRLDGRPAVEVTVFDVGPGGRTDQAVRVYESRDHRSWQPELGPYWGSTATVYTYEDRRLTLVEHVVAGARLAPGGDVRAALREARAALKRPKQRTISWDGRPEVPLPVLPEPARAWDGLAAPLAWAVTTALDRVRHRIGPLAFLHVRVAIDERLDVPALITAAAVDDAFVATVARRGVGLERALVIADQSAEGAVALDVLAVLSAYDLACLRAGLQANRADPEAVLRLATELARELDAVRDAVALVSVDGTDPFAASRAVLGDRQVDPILARLEPVSSRDDGWDSPARAELAARLVHAGLEAPAARDVADDAAWAIVLDDGGSGRTHIGGLPLVPADTAWPRHDGRPLVHVATIAFDELPRVGGGESLPDDGTLAVFADLADDAEFYEPVEPGDPGRSQIALIHTPAGAPTTRLEPPSDAQVPIERSLRPTARLQLRAASFGVGRRRYGVPSGDEATIDEVRLESFGRDHPPQLLGFPLVAQDDPRSDGEVALLHVDPDVLGLPFLDGGDVLFFLPAADLAARRWDQVTAWPSSS